MFNGLTLVTFSPLAISEIEKMLRRDFAGSRWVASEEHIRRLFPFKVMVRFTRLLSPIL